MALPPTTPPPTIRLPDYEGPAYIPPQGQPTGDASMHTIVKWWLIEHPAHLGLMLWLTWAVLTFVVVSRLVG
jgi:hypothetical protein